MATAKLNLKEIFKKLEEIAQWFNNENIDLDEALKKHEEGAKLIELAKKQLKEAENRLKKTTKQ